MEPKIQLCLPYKDTPLKSNSTSGEQGNVEPVTTKKRKKSPQNDPEYEPKSNKKTKKKNPRVFTKDDEVVILRGMLDYILKIDASSSSDVNMNDFHEYLTDEGKLSNTFTNIQVYEKFRRLREKFLKKPCNEEVEFDTEHEERVFKLSKRLWGRRNNEGDDDDEEDVEEKVWNRCPYVAEAIQSVKFPFSVKEVISYIEFATLKKIETTWIEDKLQENKFRIRKIEWESFVTEVVLDTVKKYF